MEGLMATGLAVLWGVASAAVKQALKHAGCADGRAAK